MPGEGGKGKGVVTSGAKKGAGKGGKPRLVAGKTTKELRKQIARKKEKAKRKAKGG